MDKFWSEEIVDYIKRDPSMSDGYGIRIDLTLKAAMADALSTIANQQGIIIGALENIHHELTKSPVAVEKYETAVKKPAATVKKSSKK